jgi:uracil-DNA glycosylase
MRSVQNNSAVQQAQSYIEYWKMAGVDYLIADETTNWLAVALAKVKAEPIRPAARPTDVEKSPPLMPSTAQWPRDLDALNAGLFADQTLPGTGYGRQVAKPKGAINAAYMVISDFPEESELAAGEMGSQRLLSNMLAAAGIAPDQCFFAALAYSRPTSGALPDGDKPVLAEFIRHQIGLVRPQTLLLLGTNATEMVMGKDLMNARGNLENINHDVHNMAALATFHPRTLAARPILKSQAWRDLQLIMQRDSA